MNFRKSITLVAQQPVHIPDKPQILLIPAGLANAGPPLLDQLEDLVLHRAIVRRRSFGEPADKLVQEILCRDLEVERIAAVFDADV